MSRRTKKVGGRRTEAASAGPQDPPSIDPEVDHLPRPTDAELELLRVLWRRGPSSVREVQADLDRSAGYTTVLKLLQIMLDKGWVERDERERSHRYRAAVSKPRTQQRLVDDLMARAFEGSAGELVLRALSARPVSPQELREIAALIESLEEEESR